MLTIKVVEMNKEFFGRRERLIRVLARRGMGGMLVLGRENIYYLTGWSGPGRFYCDRTGGGRLYVPTIDFVPGKKIEGVRVIPVGKSFLSLFGKVCSPGMKVIVEADKISVDDFMRLKKAWPRIEFFPRVGIVERMRLIKSQKELEYIRRAAKIAGEVMEEAGKILRVGRTEAEIGTRIKSSISGRGGEGISFEPIVAAGINAAVPHHQSGGYKVSQKDAVIIDLGVKYRGYCSDMTRTFNLGKNAMVAKTIIKVKEAQRQAMAQIKDGVSLGRVDMAARDYFKKFGWEKKFIHGLGHGVGLSVHEAPRLSPGQRAKLREGMVVTVEPGIYDVEKFAVRWEDMVLVKKINSEILT